MPGPYVVLIALSVIAGMVRGNLTLPQATAITDRWGTTHYGCLSGLLAAPTTTASALAPFAGAALAIPLGGYPQLFVALAAVSMLASVAAIRADPESPTSGRLRVDMQGRLDPAAVGALTTRPTEK